MNCKFICSTLDDIALFIIWPLCATNFIFQKFVVLLLSMSSNVFISMNSDLICKHCTKEVFNILSQTSFLACKVCKKLFHKTCINKVDIIVENDDWYCEYCLQSIFPFNAVVNNEEFCNLILCSHLAIKTSDIESLNSLAYNPFIYDRKRVLLNNVDIDPDLNYFNSEVSTSNCTYFLPEELKSVLMSYNSRACNLDKLSIMHINCAGLLSKLDSIIELNNMLNNPFHAIAVSETWLTNLDEDQAIIPEYEFISKPREHKSRGGVGIFIKCNLPYTVRKDITSTNVDFEICAIEIENKFSKNIIIIASYRPPNTNMLAFIRDVPDPVFYRIPDTGYIRISNFTGYRIIPDIFSYRIPDNTGYRIMLDKFIVSNSLTPGAFYYTYRIIVTPLLFIFTLTFEPLCNIVNIHVCM